MHRIATTLWIATALTGCAEDWYSSDTADLDVDIDQLTHVDAHLVTPPGAWPRDLYDHALRVKMDGQSVVLLGEVVDGALLDEPREIDDHWGDNVNVLDAWRDCEPGTTCDVTFRFQVACTTPSGHCSGTVSADAFLAVERAPQERDKQGTPLLLTLTERPTETASVPRD